MCYLYGGPPKWEERPSSTQSLEQGTQNECESMTTTQTENLGYAKIFVTTADEVKDEAATAGMNTDHMKAIVVLKADKAAQLNARQEALKRELAELTPLVTEAHADLYRTLSGFTDALIGGIGKGSPGARNLQRIRSRIRMPGDQTAQPAVQPNPGATQ